MMWNQTKFAERLRQAREAYPRSGSRAWSREKAAVAMGFTRNTLDNYERGATSPTVEAAARMADYYGVTMGWLLGLTEEGGPQVKDEIGGGASQPEQILGSNPSPFGIHEVKPLSRHAC